MLKGAVHRLMESYPQIYLACHRRHIRDDESGRVLTMQQSTLLQHLHPERVRSLRSLSEHLGLTSSTVSIAVSRLAEWGYVRREKSQQDKREVQLTLTSAGARVQQATTVLDPVAVSGFLKLMPPAEVERAISGIESLAQYASLYSRQRQRNRKENA
jgi:MarR family transcriptional regulator, organic hydroperoxide resistance regulator